MTADLRVVALIADIHASSDVRVETLSGGTDPQAPRVAVHLIGSGRVSAAITFDTPTLAERVAEALLAEARRARGAIPAAQPDPDTLDLSGANA